MMKRISQALFMAVVVAGCYTSGPMPAPSRGPSGMFGDNGEETLNYLKGLQFSFVGSLSAQYDCATCPNMKVQLLIMPEAKAQTRGWEGDLQGGKPGDVVAKVFNIDSVAFPELNLQPGDSAYAWVGQIASNTTPDNRGFGIYKLKTEGTRDASWSVVPKSKIYYCPHPNVPAYPSVKPHHEGVNNCVPIASSSAAGKTRLASMANSSAYALMSRSVSAAAPGVGSLWITCSGGCCQVSTN